MCTSLQSIVNVEDRTRLQQDIQLLFKPKPYPSFELQEFYRHSLYESNEHFNFFLDILEEWNRKIISKEVPNHSDTLLHKNSFVFNTLRNSIRLPRASSDKVLSHLYGWFTNTRNKKVKPAERKIKQFTQHDEDWLIRNTFKSNLPAEIDMYRRRVCCRNNNDQSQALQSGIDPFQGRKVKTENCGNDSEGLEEKKTTKIENEVIRFQREAKELVEVQTNWKRKKLREQEGGIKNFYSGRFSSCKTYFPQKRVAKEQEKSTNMITLKRVKTSLGIRSKENKQPTRLSHASQFPVTTKRQSEQTMAFDEFEEVKLSDIAGMRLMSNPLEVKIKKKKRAK